MSIYGRWIVSVTGSMQQGFPMVIGSSVSRKACDEVFLNGHIWSLDSQYHGKYVMV